MAPPEVFAATAHFLEFLGLLLAIGSLVVLRLARLEPRIAWAEPPLRNVVAGTPPGVVGLLAAGPPPPLLLGAAPPPSPRGVAAGLRVIVPPPPPPGLA